MVEENGKLSVQLPSDWAVLGRGGKPLRFPVQKKTKGKDTTLKSKFKKQRAEKIRSKR